MKPAADLILSPEVDARALLGAERVRERLARPPYATLGVGRLRVLRLAGDAASGPVEIVCGYDGYERYEPTREGGRRTRSAEA